MANELIKKENIQVVACPHPFKVERKNFLILEGYSIEEILQNVQPDKVLRQYSHIYLNDDYILESEYQSTYPQENDIVTIRVVPGKGGGKNPLKAIFTLATIAASFYFPPLLGLTGFQAFALKVAISGIGMLASNALISPSTPRVPALSGTSVRESPTLSIEGARNAERQFGVVPVILGEHKQVPPLGGTTYTEIVGNDEYLMMLVVWCYGPAQVRGMKIGETSVLAFDDIQIESREGWPTDPPLTLFPGQVDQDSISLLLKQTEDWQIRTTSADADEISIDLIFPKGLTEITDQGNREKRTVSVEVRYRPTSGGSYLSPNITASSGISANVSRQVATSVGLQYTSTVGIRGANDRYEEITQEPNAFLDPVSDIGSQQVITSGIKFNRVIGKVIATVSGGSESESLVAAIQVIIAGTDEDDNVIGETLTAFTSGTYGTVTGALDFKTVTSITIPAHDTTGAPRPFLATMSNSTTSAYRMGLRWPTEGRDQYHVEIRRITSDTNDLQIFDEVWWGMLRTFTNEDPINFPHPLCTTVIKVKATEQLNGIIDQLSATIWSYSLVWDDPSWVKGITSNPASLYYHVLKSVAMANPLPDSRIDLAGLQTWYDFCETYNLEFNQIRDYQTSVWELLSDIARAGFSSPTQIDGKWGVVTEPITPPTATQHFTPKNSWGFDAEKAFIDIPHALRVRFSNRDEDWAQDELIVYNDGFDESEATRFEQLDALGITSSDLAFIFGRFFITQIILRPERWTLNVDFEHIVSRRGDMVLVTHDVLLVGLASGRIKALITDGGGNVTGLTVDEVLTMESGKSYGISIRTLNDIELTRGIVLDIGDQTTITLSTQIDVGDAPAVDDIFGFGELGSETIKGIILSIEPQGELTARLTLTPHITALEDAITGTIPPFDTKLTGVPILPDVEVIRTRSDESVLVLGSGNTLLARIAIEVVPVSNHQDASLEVLIHNTGTQAAFVNAKISYLANNEVLIEDVEERNYYNVWLRWVNYGALFQASRVGNWTVVNNILVIGQTSPPAGLQNLTISVFGGTALLRWDAPSELDVRFGGIVKFRHHPALIEANASWEQSYSIGTGAMADTLFAQLPLKPGTYLARVFDKGRRPSTTIAKISTKQASVLAYAPHAEIDVVEETIFSGIHTNTIAIDNILKLTGVGLFDDIPDLDLMEGDLDSYGGIQPIGTYEFAAGYDFGSTTRIRLTSELDILIINVLDRIDDRTANIDTWENFDGVLDQAVCDIQVQVKSTDDDPTNSSPAWSELNTLDSAEFNNRAHDFQVVLLSTDPAYNIIVNTLQVHADEI